MRCRRDRCQPLFAVIKWTQIANCAVVIAYGCYLFRNEAVRLLARSQRDTDPAHIVRYDIEYTLDACRLVALIAVALCGVFGAEFFSVALTALYTAAISGLLAFHFSVLISGAIWHSGLFWVLAAHLWCTLFSVFTLIFVFVNRAEFRKPKASGREPESKL